VKLSTRGRYALRLMLHVARHDRDAPVSLNDAARATDISRRYLEQLATTLKGAGLLTAVSGRSGGYRLARPARSMRLDQIVQAAIGPINIVDCVLEPETCLKSTYCECRDVYTQINSRIVGAFHGLSLAELVHNGATKKGKALAVARRNGRGKQRA